jgi:hypothetical protein
MKEKKDRVDDAIRNLVLLLKKVLLLVVVLHFKSKSCFKAYKIRMLMKQQVYKLYLVQ